MRTRAEGGEDEVETLLGEWFAQSPREDVEQFIARHPAHSAALREHLTMSRVLERSLAARTPLPRRIGPFRIQGELGSGGMGTVYRAVAADATRAIETGRTVAVKLVHPHLFRTPGFFKRFLREADLGRKIDHPNVVRTLDADAVEIDGRPQHFLVMEYVEGRTLRDLLEELDRVPEELARHIGCEVAKALAAIHAAGAVHRDLKPENVLITKDHVVKVMDLGVARLADEQVRLSQTGAFVGSLAYAAPEQLRGREVDARADLHALGIVLYELAAGVSPYAHDDARAAMRRILDETPRRLGELNPQVSAFFEEAVHTLLAKAPEDRFADATVLLGVLEAGEASPWWKDRAHAIRATTHRPLRRIRIPRETALVGRDAEIARLRSLYERAKAGEGAVLLVEGEAGIGKSRLVDEFVGLLHGEGEDLNFLFGSYPPAGAATASGAFSTAYREQFGDAGSAAYLTQTPLLVPAFDALLRGDAAPTGAEPLTKDSLQTLFVHATRGLAAERPTIVLIDDLHFAPEEGRALFASLALAVPGHRVLVVGTMRPGVPESWRSQLERLGHVQRLALARLGIRDLVRLLEDALRSKHLAEELAVQIGVKSDGNPFFVFEILRGLKEGHFLAQRPDGAWHTTQVLADIQVPSSITDLVNARVADLETQDRELLDVAACLGFEFDPLLVGEVLDLPRIALLKRLAQIERAHRLVRAAGRNYVFDHHQVQEALYSSLSELLRSEYHAAIADAIERTSGAADREPNELDGALCVELAEHLLAGAQGARALRYLEAALEHLSKGHRHDAKVRLADRALAAPDLVAGRKRCELLLKKASTLGFVGRVEDERAALDEAVALADASGDAALRAKAQHALGRRLSHDAYNVESIARLSEAQSLARAAGDRRTEAAAGLSLGNAFRFLDRVAEAQQHFERSLEIANEIGAVREEVSGSVYLAEMLSHLGRIAEAHELFERSVERSRDMSDRSVDRLAISARGAFLHRRGRFADAREAHERVLAMSREAGDRGFEAMSFMRLGSYFMAVGRIAQAREHFERLLALTREIGARMLETSATRDLGHLCRLLGRSTEAGEHCRTSLAFARQTGHRSQEGTVLQLVAEIESEAGESTAAVGHLAEAIDVYRSIGRRSLEATARVARGGLLARAGRTDEARVDFDSALAAAHEISLFDTEVLATAWLAQFPGADIRAALAVLATLDGRVEMEPLMEARFLLWPATRDRAHLVEAKRLLDFMVEHAPPDCRGSMLANVRLHREIVAACKEQGIA